MLLTVRNSTRNTRLGDAIGLANTRASRRTGLLKHSGLAEGEGLWIVPCPAIHTFFMKFAIDVVYIDKKRRVKKIVPALVPSRMSMAMAHSVIELPVGAIERSRTQVGDQLEITPEPSF